MIWSKFVQLLPALRQNALLLKSIARGVLGIDTTSPTERLNYEDECCLLLANRLWAIKPLYGLQDQPLVLALQAITTSWPEVTKSRGGDTQPVVTLTCGRILRWWFLPEEDVRNFEEYTPDGGYDLFEVTDQWETMYAALPTLEHMVFFVGYMHSATAQRMEAQTENGHPATVG